MGHVILGQVWEGIIVVLNADGILANAPLTLFIMVALNTDSILTRTTLLSA